MCGCAFLCLMVRYPQLLPAPPAAAARRACSALHSLLCRGQDSTWHSRPQKRTSLQPGGLDRQTVGASRQRARHVGHRATLLPAGPPPSRLPAAATLARRAGMQHDGQTEQQRRRGSRRAERQQPAVKRERAGLSRAGLGCRMRSPPVHGSPSTPAASACPVSSFHTPAGLGSNPSTGRSSAPTTTTATAPEQVNNWFGFPQLKQTATPRGSLPVDTVSCKGGRGKAVGRRVRQRPSSAAARFCMNEEGGGEGESLMGCAGRRGREAKFSPVHACPHAGNATAGDGRAACQLPDFVSCNPPRSPPALCLPLSPSPA